MIASWPCPTSFVLYGVVSDSPSFGLQVVVHFKSNNTARNLGFLYKQENTSLYLSYIIVCCYDVRTNRNVELLGVQCLPETRIDMRYLPRTTALS